MISSVFENTRRTNVFNQQAVSPDRITDAQGYAIRHFDDMKRFATALEALPAQVVEHRASFAAFGSWWTTVRFNGVSLRIVFDGRDRQVVLERSTTSRPPYNWGDAIWRQRVEPEKVQEGNRCSWRSEKLVLPRRAPGKSGTLSVVARSLDHDGLRSA